MELHISRAAWRYLKDRYAEEADPRLSTAFGGLPVVVDDEMHDGQWEVRDDGNVLKWGDFAPAPQGMFTTYAPSFGWVAVSPTLYAATLDLS